MAEQAVGQMLRTDDLVMLSQLVDAGSFTLASRSTGVTKSRLSRRLQELEDKLGVRLIERSSRSFRVTELGSRLARLGASIRSDSEAALALVNESLVEPRGPLCIACPVVLSELLIGSVATAFAHDHPDVQLTYDVTSGLPNVDVDHYDLVFRASPSGLPSSEMIARQLMVTPYELVASPAWVEAAGHPDTPDQLVGLNGIGWWQTGAMPRWHLLSPEGEEHHVPITPRFQTNHLAVARTAAIEGLGMARLPRPICQDDLRSGRLQRVLPRYTPDPMAIYVVYPTRRSLTAAGRQFLEYVDRVLVNFRRTYEVAEAPSSALLAS